MRKLLSRHALPTLVITFVVMGFFLRLFWPQSHLFMTQDFGRSDVWHFSLPTKVFLGNQLVNGKIPLWNNDLGVGFPVFAEGQTGVFFLPNLIFFRFLPPHTAYNAALLTAFLTLTLGVYFLMISYGVSRKTGTMTAITFFFAGLPIAQMSHITLLQGFSLMPWIAIIMRAVAHRPSSVTAATGAILLSQQICAGFPQATFITLLFVCCYIGFLAWRRRMQFWGIVSSVATIAAGIAISAVQLLPSFEFLTQSTQPGGFSADIASYFSYPLTHLTTLIYPYFLGNPRYGTYPVFYEFDGSIFWENVFAPGIIPVLFAVYWVTSRRTLQKESRYISSFMIAVIIVSFLLMLGSHSPLYFIYGMWPFTLFRAPSRFVWLFALGVIVLTAFGADLAIRRAGERWKKTLITAALGVNAIILAFWWWNYHPLVSVVEWAQPPELAENTQQSVVLTLDHPQTHNDVFLRQGWKDMEPYYVMREMVAPASNIMWNVPTFGVYAGRFLHRQTVSEALINNEITVSESEATASALGTKLLEIYGIDTIISSVTLSESSASAIASVEDSGVQVTKYAISGARGRRAYVANDLHVAATLQSARDIYRSDDFDPYRSVILEPDNGIVLDEDSSDAWEVRDERYDHTEYTATVTTEGDALLVIPITYYPGWQAWVNGVPTPVVPANIRYSGVPIPEGKHSVMLQFKSVAYERGALISTVGYVTALAVVFLPLIANSGTFRTGLLRPRRR